MPPRKGWEKRRAAVGRSTSADVSTQSFTLSVDVFMAAPEDEPILSFVERTSADLRHNYKEVVPIPAPSPVKKARLEGSYTAPLPNTSAAAVVFDDMPSDLYQMVGLSEDDPPLPPVNLRVNANQFKPSDKVLNRFMHNLRDVFLKELVRRDGCADASEALCARCKMSTPLYRCQECFSEDLLCTLCCVDMHLDNPLHVVYKWNGMFFEKSALRDLGLRIQLGHAPQKPCDNPEPAPKDFIVLHDNGIHEVAVDFCGCDNHVDPCIQMLRAGWYPVTDEKPKTCATFLLLDKFLMQTLQAKTTMYDFYTTLEKLTNNEGVKLPDRYQPFIRMCREYRHLLLLKRRGRVHDPRGVKTTAPGELAIQCPACPQPGVNLLQDWEKASNEDKFLYILFLALDACFRMKHGLVSSELKDPGLGTGWAYVLESAPYCKYLLTKTNQIEMSTCSGLAALDHANTKFSRGYSSTGIGMGVCARHEFIQPTRVGDLQKGERYANMDYIFGSLLRHHHPLLYKIISYDIVCQWWKQLLARMQELPPLRANRWRRHREAVGAYRGDREQYEGDGPGLSQRHNGLPLEPLELAEAHAPSAVAESVVQEDAFALFSLQQAEHIPIWKQMVDEFEQDRTKKNPYELVVNGLTEHQVHLQFMEEEAKEARKGLPSRHEVSASTFIMEGLGIEDEQRRVRVQAELKKAKTTAQQINMGAMCTKLNRQSLGRHNAATEELAEDVPVLLPSALTATERESGCVSGLLDIENTMHDAQCRGALIRLRIQLHIKAHLLNYKRIHARHQGPNTRARNKSKIRLHSEKYQAMWKARLVLVEGDSSKVGWQRLRKEDIRLMEDAEELSRKAEKERAQAERRRQKEEELRASGEMALEKEVEVSADEEDVEDGEVRTRGGENRQQLSWIWTSAGTTGTDAELENGEFYFIFLSLRIEWAKAYTRVRRWREEVRLLKEEFRRVPLSLEYEAEVWKAHAAVMDLDSMSLPVAQGLIAYAGQQAEMQAPRVRVRGQDVSESEEEEGEDTDDEEDEAEQGHINSDEELLMGGEVDED
ncbi:hypothetical protein C8J57DRAFT_1249691 [Mycena rebaudengoi]|nr:hypothetical protein C8J57DRAFT_1249691 [Mycena rebaudengoi]